MPSKSRRDLLATLTTPVATTLLSGCLSISDRDGTIPAGSLILENDHDKIHTVRVIVTKTSENPDEARSGTQTLASNTTPISRTERIFELGSQKVKKRYINEPGAYYIQAQLTEPTKRDSGGSAWAEFYAKDDGISGGYIQIWLQSNGFVTVSQIVE